MMVTVPANPKNQKLQWWDAINAVPMAETTVGPSGGTFQSPSGACAVTLEFNGRWDSYVNGTFPTGSPAGTCYLCTNGETRPFCTLPAGQAAWGCAHDGACK
jgi:hypothetical protein